MVPSSLLPSFADSYRPNKKVLLELAGISILAQASQDTPEKLWSQIHFAIWNDETSTSVNAWSAIIVILVVPPTKTPLTVVISIKPNSMEEDCIEVVKRVKRHIERHDLDAAVEIVESSLCADRLTSNI